MDLAQLQGKTLAGRFRLEKLLGQGGYGAVFEAEQLSVGRRCAVKVLFAHLCADETTAQRFRAEARATSRLTHPNSVILYDFGRDEDLGLLFLAMELLDGQDLSSIVKGRGFMSVADAVHIARQACESLHEAHQLGLVHRDIKPRNIMLIERGNDPQFVKVIDFGIAKVVQSSKLTHTELTQTGTIIGTPKYMAPEQIRDADIDGRTDMYALAISLYQMITGRTPFDEGTPMEIAGRQLAEQPEPLSQFRSGLQVSRDFEQVLLRALAKDPADRFADMLAFADALEQAARAPATPQSLHSAPAEPAEADTLEEQTPEEGAYAEMTQAPEDILLDELRADGPHPTPAPMPVEPDAASSQPDEPAVEQPAGEEDRPEDERTLGTLAIPNPARPEMGEPDGRDGMTAEVVADIGGDTQTVDKNAEGPSKRGGLDARVIAVAIFIVVGLGAGVFLLLGGEDSTGGEEAAVAVGDSDEILTANAAAEPSEHAGGEEGPDDLENEAERAAPAADDPIDGESEAVEEPADEEPSQVEGAEVEAGEQEKSPADKPSASRRRSLEVRVIPWGTLYVDGRKVGSGTRHRVRLTEGRHTFVLEQDGQERARRTVDVTPRSSKIIELIAR